MGEFLRKHWTYLLGAVLLHALFAGVFGLTMVSMQRTPPPAQLAIQAVVVDQSVVAKASRQRQRERQRERDRAEQQQREQESLKQKQQQEEIAKREAEQRAEQERQAELKQRQEAEQRRVQEEQQQRERLEAERKREAEAERQRQAEAERKRVEEIERKQKEAAEKRRAAEEAKAQQAREEELRRQLEAEEGVAAAESAGLKNQYIAMLEQHIYRYWNRPPSARPGLECEIKVSQTPAGVVLSVQIGACNGDAAVRQSIENAVLRASPLPKAPDPRVFERVLLMRFRPTE
jgi:colicin import membrane protein